MDVHHGIVDNDATRAIVCSLASPEDGINLAEAHERLQQLLGASYDTERWGKLLDSVHAEPGKPSLLTVEAAFELYRDSGGGAGASEAERQRNLQAYRRLAKQLF